MQSMHFIAALIEVYERTYSLVAAETPPHTSLIETAIWAADQVAANNWHNAAQRAGAVGAALVRVLHAENAEAEAAGLTYAIVAQIGGADPEPRA